MILPVRLTEEALQEEAEAYLFYEEEAQDLREQFLREVEMTLQKVAENPTHYSFSDSTKTIRDIALIKFPFVIIMK